jgi:DNA-directed RNA polymerase specialized sigma24 family protein
MDDNKWLEKVAQHHKEWVEIIHKFGEYDYAEDIVQETYIALYKTIILIHKVTAIT